MKKMIFLMLALFFLSAASVNAQVNIGSKDSPKDGALLDLSRSGKNLGLILPNVNLTNLNDWQLDAGSGADAAGTVVFNTNAGLAANGKTLGQGIFVWNGNGWQAAKGGTGVVLAQDFTLMSNSDPFADGDAFYLYTGSTKSFTVEAGSFQPSSPDIAQGVKWVISPASIAAIKSGSTSTTCVVEGVSPGDANLTVTSLDNNVTKTITIHVLPVTLDAFELDKTTLDLIAGGDEGTVTAEDFVGTDGNPYSATVTWSIKDGVDPTNSKITPAGNTVTVEPGIAGSFTLRATAEGESRDCEVVISDLDPTAYSSTPEGITVGLDGVFCYDARSEYAAEADYPLTVTGSGLQRLDKVTWVITDTKAVQRLAATLTNTNAHLVLNNYFYVREALAPAEITITAYIDLTLTNDQKEKTSVSKTIKFQNARCCDGAIIYGAAWNYASGSLPGDGAKVGGADDTTNQTWSPNININSTGEWGATALESYFTKANIDLCVYKKNYKSSGDTNGRTSWVNAVNNCANGTYADGDATVGWYLPNERELQSIYQAIGGNGGSSINFANLNSSTGTISTTAENMVSFTYWSSTEFSDTNGLLFGFSSGNRTTTHKTDSYYYVRCVKRLYFE
ncbi:hypothetical protein FACS189474_3010 [Bacteroidia bacterium]|nr:hypothetical protein FACS189474_3010 [Bacteroidia bacterium]